MNKSAVGILVGCACLSLHAVERVVYQEHFEQFVNYTEAFNEGAKVGEDRSGTLCLWFTPKAASDFRAGCFKIPEPPCGREWKFSFLYRFEREQDNEFTLTFLFGDRGNPDVRTLTVAEAGSHFGCDAVPPPEDGMAGFLPPAWRNWNKGAVIVSGGKASFWTYRSGRLVKECETAFPAKPLVGWNLGIRNEKGGEVFFDRVVITDGTARPYDRGDPTEWLAQEWPRTAWDPKWGAAVADRKPMPVDFNRQKLEARMRFPGLSTGNVGRVSLVYNLEKGAPLSITFSPGGDEAKLMRRTFGNGRFTNAMETVKLPAEKLGISGAGVMERTYYHARPPMYRFRRYLQREINEIYLSLDRLPRLDGSVLALETVRIAPNRYRVFLDRNVLAEFDAPSPVVSVGFQGRSAEFRARTAPAPSDPDPQVHPLPFKAGGFALERVRENMGTYAIECSGYLSRDAFDAMPSSCLFNVPRRMWTRAKAICRVNSDAPASAVPVITARLTQFWQNGGRALAMCEKTVDLRKDSVAFVKKGDDYEVTFDFDIGSLQDLVMMDDGMGDRPLSYLHLEFLGPLWEKSRFYMDSGRSPSESEVSSLVVLSGELQASPADMKAVANGKFSLYYPDEEAGATVTVVPRVPGEYAVEAVVSDETGKVVERQSFRTREALERRLVFAKAQPYGWYAVRYDLRDASGRTLVTHEASFVRLRSDTRRAGYDSPYFAWNFLGAHGTPKRIDDWGVAFRRLGVKSTLLHHPDAKDPVTRKPYREDSPDCRRYGLSIRQHPYWYPGKRTADEMAETFRKSKDAFPHADSALVLHESGWGEFPRELYGEVSTVTDETRADDAKIVAEAKVTAEGWRKADPKMKLVYGNSDTTVGLLARLMRGGFPKELFDAMGEEGIGMTEPPEMTSALIPWEMKRLARHYGYSEAIECPYEWKSRFFQFRYAKDRTPHAGIVLRDVLIAHALGYSLIPFDIGTETGNSYANSIWCNGGFSRWPLAYPRPEAAAAGFLTQLLDRAKFVRMVPTGSLTVYALEFKTEKGLVYALWDARGETAVAVDWKPFLGFVPKTGEGEVFSYSGRSVPWRDDGRIAIGEEPVFLVTDDGIESFAADLKRAFPRERHPGMEKARVVQTLASTNDFELVLGRERRLEVDNAAFPRRPGVFDVAAVRDGEKGECLEVTHRSKPTCPEIVMEYATLRIRDPKPIEGPFSTLGIWVKGNSNWGRVFFELTDAEGEKWTGTGIGGVGCNTYDWPCKMATNYDGWNFLQLPVTRESPVTNASPGNDFFQWVRDGTGNGRMDFPVRVTSVFVGQFGRTLDILEMASGSPTVSLGSIEVW